MNCANCIVPRDICLYIYKNYCIELTTDGNDSGDKRPHIGGYYGVRTGRINLIRAVTG